MVGRRQVLRFATVLAVLGAAFAPAGPASGATAPKVGRAALRQTPPTSNKRVWDNADPGVLVVNGRTFLFGSSNNMRLPVREITSFTSTIDQTRAQWAAGAVDAMPTKPPWIDPGERDIWAPSPIKIGSRYYVYFAGKHKGATTDEANDQCIGRASSSRAMGPYTPMNSPLYCGLAPEAPGTGSPRRTGSDGARSTRRCSDRPPATCSCSSPSRGRRATSGWSACRAPAP